MGEVLTARVPDARAVLEPTACKSGSPALVTARLSREGRPGPGAVATESLRLLFQRGLFHVDILGSARAAFSRCRGSRIGRMPVRFPGRSESFPSAPARNVDVSAPSADAPAPEPVSDSESTIDTCVWYASIVQTMEAHDLKMTYYAAD